MTREQFEKCKPYEQTFKWAIRSNFVHLSTSEFSEIAKLYKEILGVTMTKAQMTCGTCRLNALKALGKDFFDTMDILAKEQQESPVEEETEAPKKKGGRPKKINIED